MRTRFLIVAAVLLAAACSGVLFDAGNAYPCHFDQPPGMRDLACAPGDVCGVNDLCQHFVNEGPRFEGAPTLPDFSARVDAGEVLHPRILKEAVQGIGLDPVGAFDLTVTAGDVDYVLTTHNRIFPMPGSGLPLAQTFIPLGGAAANILGAGLLQDAGVRGFGVRRQPGVAPSPQAGGLYADLWGAAGRIATPLFPLKDFRQLRAVGTGRLGFERLKLLAIDDNGSAGEISVFDPSFGIRLTAINLQPYAVNSRVVDLAWASRPPFESPVLLTRTDLLMQADDGGFVSAYTFPTPILDGDIRSDARSNVFAFVSTGGVLSTWKLVRSGTAYSFEQAWPDCTPCGGSSRPLTFTPSFRSAGTTVEVLCGSVSGGKVGVRVLGSNATDPVQRCDLQAFEPPFNVGHLLARDGRDCRPGAPCVQDFAAQSGVALGGSKGEVWLGPSLSEVLPLYLDRVPLDVTLASVNSTPLLVALTDRYVARDLGEGSNGLLVVRPLEDSPLVGADLSITALVHQSGSWALTASGDLAHLNAVLPDGGAAIVASDGTIPVAEFGPRLVNGRGEPVANALVGEAYVQLDGGVRSAVLAVDDSLYFVPFDFVPADAPGLLGDLGPVLTPEPSTLIRSIALERTPLGSNGVDRMRGYAVTSRNVYQFALGGSPARWSATPVFLWGGEPVETWFDQPRGGLARVGYRDGTIFTLPGGFQLSEALPAGDAGITSAVVDYENLGGWPVALATTGLYVARWPVERPDGGLALPDGGLDRHFPDGGVNKPMSWFEVKLPDGSRPWLGADGRARQGKLFVRVDPTEMVPPSAGQPARYLTTFHLLLFLDDQVIEVGRHQRSNTSKPPGMP